MTMVRGSESLRLLDRLGDVGDRKAAADALAQHLGADALFVFVPDPDRSSKLIPVPGFPALPSLRHWRDLLARCLHDGVETGRVSYPDAGTERDACAYVFHSMAIVVVGHSEPRPEVRDELATIARVLSAMFCAEVRAMATHGELDVERRNSERISSLARALDSARGEAERATRVKDEFLAMLGHELRNPLAPIVTALQMLRLEGVNTRAQGVLERQVEHLRRLVDDLLDISRITSGKIELRRERVDLATAVARATEMSRPLLEQRRNLLTIDVPPGLFIDGDPDRLAQVISNLVTNAAKYSDPGASIEIRAERAAEIVRLAVTDHGIGIDASYVDRVFDRFIQVPQGLARSAGGLGLGLTIVRSLVERHGGKVYATSGGVGCGSTFTVELSLCHAPATPPTPVVGERALAKGMARLLVVDDNMDAATLLAELLGAHGHDVRVAYSGPEALDVVHAFCPDAAVLDIGLPVMDGYELARQLRDRLPGVKLVALTGYGQANDRERSRAAGFHAHLVKPVMIANVTRTLADLLATPTA